jgi:deoxyadenosine/deoxycytidine kinase
LAKKSLMDKNTMLGYYFSSVTAQITNLFNLAYGLASKNKFLMIFKQEQKEYEQVLDIYFNSKRFELVTL